MAEGRRGGSEASETKTCSSTFLLERLPSPPLGSRIPRPVCSQPGARSTAPSPPPALTVARSPRRSTVPQFGWLASPPLIRTTFCRPLPFFFPPLLPAAPFAAPAPLPLAAPHESSSAFRIVCAARACGLASAARMRARLSDAEDDVGSEGKSRPEAGGRRAELPLVDAGREIERGVTLALEAREAGAEEDEVPPSVGKPPGEVAPLPSEGKALGPARVGVAPAAEADDDDQGVEPPTARRAVCCPALAKPGIDLVLDALMRAGNGFERGATGAGPDEVAARSTRSQVVDGLVPVRC